MQLTSYDSLTPHNIIFKEAKDYKVLKIRKLNTNAFQLKSIIRMERKVV